jgi:hypothetical protein
LLALQKIDPSAGFGPPVADARPTPAPPKEIVDDATKSARTARKAALGGGAAAGANESAKTTSGTQIPDKPPVPLLPSFASYSLIGVAVAIAIAATVIVARRKAAVHAIW